MSIVDTLRFGAWGLATSRVPGWNGRDVHALQQHRLRRLLHHAAKHSPFYAERLRRFDLDRCRLTDLPITNKHELMANFDDVVTDRGVKRQGLEAFMSDVENSARLYRDKYPVIHTSGSQGQPVFIVLDPLALEVLFALQMTRGNVRGAGLLDAVHGLLHPHRLAVIAMKQGFYPQGTVWRHMPEPARLFLNVLTLAPSDTDLIDRLNAFNPMALTAYASVLEWLALHAERLRLPELQQIVSNSETLSQRSRRRFERTFGVPILDNYSMGECGFLTVGCHTGPGCHVNSDWAILEPVDDQYRPVPPGQTASKVLLTNLANFVQPFIRYEIGDRVTMAVTPCHCRNHRLPRVERVDGRAADFFWVSIDGQKRQLLSHVFKNAFEYANEVREWQAVKENDRRIRLRIETLPGHRLDVERLNSHLRKQLDMSHLADGLRFVIDPASRIVPDPATGKIKRMIDQVQSA